MWTRIYLGVLAAAVLVVGFFSYYSWGWLQSIGRPQDAIAGFQHTSGIAWTMLCVCSIGLFFAAAGVMWSKEKAWALWSTFAYFAVFLGLQGFWLNRGYQELLERSTGIDMKLWATPVISALIILGAAVVTLATQYAIVVLRRKFYPSTEPPEIDVDAEDESSRFI